MNKRRLKARLKAEAREQLLFITRMERRFQVELRKELTLTGRQAAEMFPVWEKAIPQHQHRLQSLLEKWLMNLATDAGNRIRLSFKSAHLLDRVEIKLDTSEQLAKRISKWARKHSAKKVVDISKTTERRIRRTIIEGLNDDLSPAEIARNIVDDNDDISLGRAKTIARTETHTAAMTGQQMNMEEASEDLGMEMNKVWISTEDARTRQSHIDADGQTVGMREWFKVGESELYIPGDPDGAPEEVINCRCAVTYEPAP